MWETAEQTMSGEAELEFARIWRPIPKVVFARTLNSVAGNARLATDDIATEVGRLRDQRGEGVVAICPFSSNLGQPTLLLLCVVRCPWRFQCWPSAMPIWSCITYCDSTIAVIAGLGGLGDVQAGRGLRRGLGPIPFS